MRPTLHLTKDTLSELAPEELANVVGAQMLTGLYPTLPVDNCLSICC